MCVCVYITAVFKLISDFVSQFLQPVLVFTVYSY